MKCRKMCFKWTPISFLAILVAQCCFTEIGAMPGCEFPDEWLGEWYEDGQRDPVQLSKEDFSDKGMCFKQTGNMHVVYNREMECYRCLVFFDRHINVLQFKEGNCNTLNPGQEDVSSVEEICSDVLTSETRLKTLVKVSGPDISCPFHGKFLLAYNKKGGPVCRNKKSKVDECMTNTQVAFKFEQCPNQQGQDNRRGLLLPQLLMENANNGVEILTCKGSWHADEGGGGGDSSKESEHAKYLVGILDHALVSRIDQKLHCFLFRPAHNGKGFSIGQSHSCHGLNKVEDAERVIDLIPIPEDESLFDEGCSFPEWATVMGPMKSLTYTSHYEFSPDGTSLVLSNYSYISGESHQIAVTSCLEVKNENLGQNVKVLARVTAGCDTQYKCMKLFKRGEHVIEIQEGKLTAFKSQACTPDFMDELRLPYTTLLKSDPPMVTCTANGNYNVTELNLKGTTDPCSPVGFGQISIRCQQPELIEFIQECGSTKDSDFFCMGGWEEEVPYSTLLGVHEEQVSNQRRRNGLFHRSTSYNSYVISDDEQSNVMEDYSGNVTLGFLIARPKSEEDNAPRRVCFTYMAVNDTEYSWTVYTAACLRNVRPGQDGLFKFNATKLESCDADTMVLKHSLLLISLNFLWLSTKIRLFL